VKCTTENAFSLRDLVLQELFEIIVASIDVLLTVRLSIFISVINQLDGNFFLFYNKFILCLYMFRAHVLIIRRSKLHYTASGIITPIGGRLVHQTATYKCDDTRGCVMQF